MRERQAAREKAARMIEEAATDHLDAQFEAVPSEERPPEQSPALLAVRDEKPIAAWTPSFAVSVDEAIDRKREKSRFFREVMDEGKHYGKIPGAGDKPTLLKPGAEMLLSNMGLHAEFEDEEPPVVDLQGSPEHGGEMLIHYRRRCSVYKQTGPTEAERMCMARASGSCSSREKKYRFRNASVACPECGKAAVIRGKAEYGGGFVCFKKKDGCGAKFAIGDRRIADQGEGQERNVDLADLENTILKMADKRALVAATLIATGCSDIFTQDVEDAPQEPPDGPYAEPRVRTSVYPGGGVVHAAAQTPLKGSGRPPSAQRQAAPRTGTNPDSFHAAEAFKIAVALGLVPDDKVIFKQYCSEKFAGKGWAARLAELENLASLVDEGQETPHVEEAVAEHGESTHRKLEKRVLAICRKQGISDDVRHALIMRIYAKTSLTHLNETQLAEFGDLLEQGRAA
jgi:hypothetical protein